MTIQGSIATFKSSSRLIRTMYWWALIPFILAFIVWNIDNELCHHLKDAREVHPALVPLTQLHAWWHVGVGIGSYAHIMSRYVRPSSRAIGTHHHPCSSALRAEARGLKFEMKVRMVSSS